MIKKEVILDIIFWTAMAVLVAWTVAKAIGLINSPTWIEAIPYATVIFVAGSLWQKLINISDGLTDVKRELINIKKDVSLIDKRLYGLEKEHNLVMKNVNIKGHKF